MEREKTTLLHDRCWEVYEKSNLGESKKRVIFSRWYFSLTDEERDYLDASNLSFCVSNTRGVRADKKRREALREARGREVFLKELKKNLALLKRKGGTLYEGAVVRAERLISLFNIRLPTPMGSESSYDYFYGCGWNNCVMEAVKRGVILAVKEKDQGKPVEWAMADGWNAAREEILRKFPEFSKAV